jgi:hypothetical protein
MAISRSSEFDFRQWQRCYAVANVPARSSHGVVVANVDFWYNDSMRV